MKLTFEDICIVCVRIAGFAAALYIAALAISAWTHFRPCQWRERISCPEPGQINQPNQTNSKQKYEIE